MRNGVAVGLVVIAFPAFGALALFLLRQERPGHGVRSEPVPAAYVGRRICAECHQPEHDLWRGSHHDLAIQEVSEETVLGLFDNTKFVNFGLTSTFYKRDGRFFVRTDGPDGRLQDYPIAYTFGVTPLQQYLIAFPGGRYQALSISWDTRPKAEGGQRWFHLYPDEKITHDDPLHWTAPAQTWNHMCAECHSTNLKKNYDARRERYATAWSEIDVSCEACHGPGSRHVDWARAVARGERLTGGAANGLVVKLKDPSASIWVHDKKTGNAKRLTPLRSGVVVETCARCHSRRGIIHEEYVHGRPLLDSHRLVWLTAPLYHADGQILDEVYVHGSFLQSKMFHNHVTCTDCHDPHSLKLRAPGNAVCHRCHLAAKFDTPSHHFHKDGSQQAECVACHMPARTYMVVDPRRDHSMRVPRPDLSARLGVPNACNGCHRDKTSAWAAQAMDRWYGKDWRSPHYGEVLHAGRARHPGADRSLAALAGDGEQPAIVRATALAMLAGFPGTVAIDAAGRGAVDPDPLVRQATVEVLHGAPLEVRLRLAFVLLHDAVRTVRLGAARVLAEVPAERMSPAQRQAVDRGVQELESAERVNADRPGLQMNLGNVHAARGEHRKAEQAYRTALRLDPHFVQARVNLADIYRAQGRDAKGEEELREAARLAPENPEVHHALGLLLVRRRRLPEALLALEQAVRLRPSNPRFNYVFGIALHTVGKTQRAIAVLEKAHVQNPDDQDILVGLVTINRDRGAIDVARSYALELVRLAPDNPSYRRLYDSLRR